MSILFVDACPRAESRTRRLAEAVINNLEGEIKTVRLKDSDIPSLDENALNKRNEACAALSFDDSMFSFAKDFAKADTIVIAAPFWDLSFPAVLKKYIEAITVSGLSFKYDETGKPMGLCKAQNLYYVTTAGGPIFNDEFGYGYIKTLAEGMFGVKHCHCFKAEALDIFGTDVDSVMEKAIADVNQFFKK